jgi:acyl carrier protein
MPDRDLESVRQMAADVLGVPAASLSAASGPDTVEAWDSVAHLNLIMAAEERFQISLSPEEMEGIHSLQDLAALLAGRAG